MSVAREEAEKFKTLGNEFFNKKQYIPAVENYTRAIEVAPADDHEFLAVLYGNRAFANLKMENFGLTLSDSDKALELDAKYMKAHYRKGSAHMVLGKFQDALADFKKVVEALPNDKDAKRKYLECRKAMREAAFFEAIATEEVTAESEINIDSIEVGSDYTGPHLIDGTVTLDFVTAMLEHFKNQKLLHKKYAFQIIIAAKRFFDQQPTLIDIELPPNGHISVCGDTHGQFFDLMNLFEINGLPSETNMYLFNGDFVDRGSWSTEVLFTVLAFKLLYPKHFFISRGNHETTAMNKIYGFEGEIKAKYSQSHCDLCRELFCLLPLCHLIGGKVFCVHGGLSTQNDFTLDAIRKINRKREPQEGTLMSELLWADPQMFPGRSPSKRGVGWSFGPDYTAKFLKENGLDLVIRSHEVRDKGYTIEHNGQLITVFTAPNYCDQVGNEGAWVTVKREGDSQTYSHKCTSFSHVPHPTVPPMAYASGLFGL
eukprot:TRINITY_DN5727_c0_g1_i1.p1 TRINITY_DN5727_c0_g1~~TRINITY_DN5727_c0_g1_i1.p1  ORF type:complete len:484 (-),score=125.10 TRINITY_DN5727_c0_g1_i1:47-1498(-)